jgi:hypothetical protein
MRGSVCDSMCEWDLGVWWRCDMEEHDIDYLECPLFTYPCLDDVSVVE